MNNLSSILTVVVAVAIAGIAYLWRRVTALEGQIRQAHKSLAERNSEAERAAKNAKDKASDLQQTKKLLHETRAKMKRLQKESNSSGSKRNRSTGSSEPEQVAASQSDAVAAVVHVSNQELESRFSEKVAALQKKLETERDRVKKLEAAAARQKKDAEEARRALHADTPATGTTEEKLSALEERFDAYRKEAEAESKKLKKAVTRAESKERAALRRANNNHSLYLVIKGQLELAEDKVALFRRRYEGAKTPLRARAEADPVDVPPPPLPEPDSTPVVDGAPASPDAAAVASAQSGPTDSTEVEKKENSSAPEAEPSAIEPEASGPLTADAEAGEQPKEPAEA